MTTKKIFPCLLFLLIFIPFIESCNEDKKIVDSPDFLSVQIINFKMSSSDTPELAKTFFSIDHRKGLIYNARPLAYQSEINKVKVSIKTPSSNEIHFFIDGKERKLEGDSLILKGWEKGTEIRIKGKEHSIEKVYKLNINRHQYNPLLFVWKKVGDKVLPETDNVTGMSLAENARYIYLSYSFHNRSEIYRADRKDLSKWTTVATFPYEIKSFYTLGEDGIVIFSTKNILSFYSFQTNEDKTLVLPFDKDYKAYQLMGAFSVPGEKGYTLSLLLKKISKSYFAKVSIDITSGQVSSSQVGYPLEGAFPDKVFYSTLIEEAHYPKLVAIGGRTDINSTPGVSMSLWSTTTALDWTTPTSLEISTYLPHVESIPTLLYDRLLKRYYLYLSISPKGYHIYYSGDGVIWDEGKKEVMLDGKGEPIGGVKNMLGFSQEGHRIVLMGGQDASEKWLRSLWIGSPKIYEKK